DDPLPYVRGPQGGGRSGKTVTILQFNSFVQSSPVCERYSINVEGKFRGRGRRVMAARWTSLALLVCLGCQMLGCQHLGFQALPHPKELEVASDVLWQQGQEAMRAGRTEEAIGLYKKCLARKEPDPRTHLSLAAAYVA